MSGDHPLSISHIRNPTSLTFKHWRLLRSIRLSPLTMEKVFGRRKTLIPSLFTPGAFPTINAAMKNIVERQVDMEEVQTARFDIGAYKAPGPDGIHGIFYQG